MGARRALIGNDALLNERGVDTSALSADADALRTDGQTVMMVAVDGKAAGLIAVADPVKPSAVDAIRLLR